MKPGSRQAATLVSLIVPAMLALWFARYLSEIFFPGVTLVDLGASCAVGLVSGLATGISRSFSRTTEGEG